MAETSLALGADYIGVVLAKSRRQVSLEIAASLALAVPGRAVAVMRVVPPEGDMFWNLPWAGLQVYGQASADWVPETRRRGWLAIQPGLSDEDRQDADVLLLEGPHPGAGECLPWHQMVRPESPFWLAGGLTPENVGEAISALHPDGVDVSSGVERGSAKDPALIAALIKEVKAWQT